MHLFDPSRPKLASGRPCLLNTHRVTGVPTFDLNPMEDDKIEIEVMLRYDVGTGFIWYLHICEAKDLSQFFTDYINDPEKILMERFNWDPTKIVKDPVHEARLAPKIKTEPTRRQKHEPQFGADVDVEELDF